MRLGSAVRNALGECCAVSEWLGSDAQLPGGARGALDEARATCRARARSPRGGSRVRRVRRRRRRRRARSSAGRTALSSQRAGAERSERRGDIIAAARVRDAGGRRTDGDCSGGAAVEAGEARREARRRQVQPGRRQRSTATTTRLKPKRSLPRRYGSPRRHGRVSQRLCASVFFSTMCTTRSRRQRRAFSLATRAQKKTKTKKRRERKRDGDESTTTAHPEDVPRVLREVDTARRVRRHHVERREQRAVVRGDAARAARGRGRRALVGDAHPRRAAVVVVGGVGGQPELDRAAPRVVVAAVPGRTRGQVRGFFRRCECPVDDVLPR